MGDVAYIWFRGFRMSPAVRDALLAAEQRAGFNFVITQGGFNRGGVAASAGTHDGDALDFRTWHLPEARVATMIEALRWAGFAAWYRTTHAAHYGVRAHGFSSRHVHAVPNGWGSPSAGARRQAQSYRNGRDGLASNGVDRGGPGHVPTWYTRTTPRKPDTRTPLERILATMQTSDLTRIVQQATSHIPKAVLDQRIPVVRAKRSTTRSLGTLVESHDAALARLETAVAALTSQVADRNEEED